MKPSEVNIITRRQVVHSLYSFQSILVFIDYIYIYNTAPSSYTIYIDVDDISLYPSL